jgi:hypothetical protein
LTTGAPISAVELPPTASQRACAANRSQILFTFRR